ncbi:MAG: ABC transporter substrate-binding protein [Campylobacteraceae bacterium]|jgi:NitT/TauT family transport system substrate-binding protein|nr:ABC transporter substrate-binding protein [Campylobacteraceae bacterium]
MKRGLVIAFLTLFMGSSLWAEVGVFKISRQHGLSTLPFIVINEWKLIEKYAKEAGLGDVRVEYVTLTGGAATNEALLSGSIHINSNGAAPFIRLWDKTNGRVKAISSSGKQVFDLVSSNPKVASIKDLSDDDKIALPAAKVSIQSLILQIATAREFGIKNYDKFDRLSVTLSSPDAFVALTSNKSEINAHFGSEPFTTVELQNSNIHKILSSADVVSKDATTSLYSTTQEFYDQNPKLIRAFLRALNDAIIWINNNQKEAVDLYVKSEKSKESPELLLSILKSGNVQFGLKPTGVTVFSDFLYETGAIKSKPAQKDLFFDAIFETDYK